MSKWLPEQLKTIRNLCDVALLVIKEEQWALLPTVLELLYEEAQTVVNENCIEEGQSSLANELL